MFSLQVKYYGAEQFGVDRYKSAIINYQVCCVDVTSVFLSHSLLLNGFIPELMHVKLLLILIVLFGGTEQVNTV